MYPKFRVSHVLAVLLALVPLAYLVRLCVLRTVDVPFWDAWSLVPRLDRLTHGALTLEDFRGLHNEHRPAVPIAVMLLLARLSGWDTRWEIAFNLAVGAAIFAVYCLYLRTAWRAHGGAPIWLVPAFSLLLFSTVQWENWLWGWQMTVLLCALFSALIAYLLAQGPRPGRLWGAIAGAVAASYSFGSGLILWPSQAPGVWIAGGSRRLARLGVWTAIGILTWVSYFYDFRRAGQPSALSNFTSLAAVRAYVTYVFTYLGTPIASYDSRLTILAGLAAVAGFAALLIRLRGLRTDPVYLFPMLVGLQSIASAFVSGLGRTWMGIDQARSSRYTTLTIPLWCAVMILAVLWRRKAPVVEPLRHRHWALTAATVVLILGMLASSVKSTREGVFMAAGHTEIMMFARRGVLSGRSDTLLLRSFPVVSLVRQYRATLMRLHMGPFRPSAQPSYPLPGPE